MAGRPAIDLDIEVAVQTACRALIAEGVVQSAHDSSDGGLAVALVESCITGGLGFRGDFEVKGRWDAALFGEYQSRIVVSLKPERAPDLERICRANGVPWTRLGYTHEGTVTMGGLVDVALSELDDIWRHGLERAVTRP